MDPIDVVVADIARSTLAGCARSIVVELAELAGGARKLAEQVAAEDAVKECLSVLLQVRSSADFGAVSAKALRKFGLALGEFAGRGDVQGHLMLPYIEEACDPVSAVVELDRLWRVNQEDLRLPQLPAGYWARAFEEYRSAVDKAISFHPLLERVRGGNAPGRRAALPEALQLLEQHIAADANPPRPPR